MTNETPPVPQWRAHIQWVHSTIVQDLSRVSWQQSVALVCVLGLIAAFLGMQSFSGTQVGFFQEIMTQQNREHSLERWNTWTTRGDEWQTSGPLHNEQDARNWAGLQKLRGARALGSARWDESAHKYIMAKLTANQFRADCAQVHWIAKFDWHSGLLSNTHMFFLPFFPGFARGYPVLDIGAEVGTPAYIGCGDGRYNQSLYCFFNITNCAFDSDQARLEKILSMEPEDKLRTTWQQVLGEEKAFFAPNGVTVTQSWKYTEVCVASSIFMSHLDAAGYYTKKIWLEMGEHGDVGIVTGFHTNTSLNAADRFCNPSAVFQLVQKERLNMVMVSLMSSWMMNQVHSDVKRFADQIMSKYNDEAGQPLWRPPVLAIHIRHGDKTYEDPYYVEHNEYRPVSSFVDKISEMEEQNGFKWETILVLSDSGESRDELINLLIEKDGLSASTSSNDTTSTCSRAGHRCFIKDDFILQTYHEVQLHFLAKLYIVHKIADHALVTFSSNVGRFMAELITARTRLSLPIANGPVATSLDYHWLWHWFG